MNDTLKVAGRIGAELGAAKAEVERLREVLSRIANLPMYHCSTENDYRLSAAKAMAVAALSQQPEPTDTYTAVDMATAAAQGFRDGQAAVEPVPVQDERKTFEVEIPDISAIYDGRSFIPYRSLEAGERLMTVAQHLRIEKQLRAALTRPAQAEQQPVAWVEVKDRHEGPYEFHGLELLDSGKHNLYAAPIAQTAPQGKFRMGDLVKKSTGSEWEGRVVGTYSTEQTKEGYAVESEAHKGSVQIYPAKALEAVE